MKRRSFLKGIFAAVTVKAFPLPKVKGALVGEVAPAPEGFMKLARPLRVLAHAPIIYGIRERLHQPFWNTLERVKDKVESGSIFHLGRRKK